MKTTRVFTAVIIFMQLGWFVGQAQQSANITDNNFTPYNRDVSYDRGSAYLNAKKGDGLLWLNGLHFENGVIELDIKGRNVPGQSFVGIAFHGQDNETFDAVYFRPFNFTHPERNKHSVQYISMPEYDWSALRRDFPGKYENSIDPVPDPVDGWFHVKFVVNYPEITVYVNGSDRPVLEVKQISDRKKGKIGFWTGNGSDGWFRNLKISGR